MVGHEVVLHPGRRLQLFPAMRAFKDVLKHRGADQRISAGTHTGVVLRSGGERRYQFAGHHVLLQALHCLPAHTLTLGAGDAAFRENLQLPGLLLTSC